MSELLHYGLTFLQLIKDDGQYGAYFSYEEYQELKNASEKDSFEKFITHTHFKDVHVFEAPEHTYQDFKIILGIQEERETGWHWILDLGGYGGLIGIVLAPFLLPVAIIVCRRKIRTLKRERIELAEMYP